jgi:uncharacterized membrane protein
VEQALTVTIAAMRYLIFAFGAILAALAVKLYQAAPTDIQEIEACLVFLIGSVLVGIACLSDVFYHTSKKNIAAIASLQRSIDRISEQPKPDIRAKFDQIK